MRRFRSMPWAASRRAMRRCWRRPSAVSPPLLLCCLQIHMQIKSVELELRQAIEERAAAPRITQMLPAAADTGAAADGVAQRCLQSVLRQARTTCNRIGDTGAVFQARDPLLVADRG